jgi:hypothetical protein
LLEQEFLGGTPAGFVPRDYIQNNYACFVLNADGKVYFREPYNGIGTTFFTYQFPNFPMEYQGKEIRADQLIPGVQCVSNIAGLYDKNNRRILWRNVSNYSVGIVTPKMSESVEQLDFNDLGTAELLFCDVQNAGDIRVLYRKDGKVFVQKCIGTVSTPNLLVTGVTNRELSETDQAYFTANTHYYLLRKRPYLFLSTDNKLFFYDLDAHRVTTFYTFAAGENVVDMSSNPQASELGVVLSNGKFVTLDITNEHLMNTHIIGEKTVPGKIVDLEYKHLGFWDANYETAD